MDTPTQQALNALLTIATDTDEDSNTRIAAARAILDNTYTWPTPTLTQMNSTPVPPA